jgi:recombinational DNA repair ATPase RecF
LYVRNVHIQNVKLLKDVRLSFLRGDEERMWTVLVGENGLGKTTILQCIALAASGRDRANHLADVPSLPDRRTNQELVLLRKLKTELTPSFPQSHHFSVFLAVADSSAINL